ncbi:MAG: KpsF/GutQ family sugar-phosphate isomerase [Thermodesulfobacteriota bacterium]
MPTQLAKEVLRLEAEGILGLIDRIDGEFLRAVDIVMTCPTRVVVSGIGKSGIVGQKIAATLNSTGTRAFFLHPVEAMHGDLGIVDSRDVLLALSYSGNTEELNRLVTSLRGRGLAIIAMTGNPVSPLAEAADVILNIAVPKEACPLGLAPTTSTTAALAMGDALAVTLLDRKKFDQSDFRRNHPGGSLGERLKVKVEEVMQSGDRIPAVARQSSFLEAVEVANRCNLGAVLVLSPEKNVLGILTDGDIRRLLATGQDLSALSVTATMTASPKHARLGQLAADALSIMQRHEITILPVLDGEQRLAGVIHLHDLLGKGEFRLLC